MTSFWVLLERFLPDCSHNIYTLLQLGLLLPLVLTPPQAIASPTVVEEVRDVYSTTTVVSLIEKHATDKDVNIELSKKIAFCESSYQPYIYGDDGKAYSVYQFHKPTFDMFAKEYGKQMDYENVEHHIELANWAFSKGEEYLNHWTCYRKVKNL